MQRIINVWIWLLIIPSLLIVIIPLLDAFFNVSFIDYIDQIMWWLDFVVWSNNVNYVFQILWIIMFYLAFKWILKFISTVK